MRVLAIVHQDDAGPGVFADAVRAAGHELEVWRPARGEEPPTAADAVLVFGGAMDTRDPLPWLPGEKAYLANLVEQGIPILGVCLGAQLLAEAAGGSVRRAREPEIGWREIEVDAGDDPLLGALPDRLTAFSWHSFQAVPPAEGVALAKSSGSLQAFRLNGTPQWGIQFHAEVTAKDMRNWIRNFHKDPDAAGLDPGAVLAESEQRLDEWNELGRALCARFLAAAEQ